MTPRFKKACDGQKKQKKKKQSHLTNWQHKTRLHFTQLAKSVEETASSKSPLLPTPLSSLLHYGGDDPRNGA